MCYFFFKKKRTIKNLLLLGVDIKNKGSNITAPTPQNTPISPAPITSSYNLSMNTISEDIETITTAGKRYE